jgi:predicted  nucleic acid-binding Zn-ribbon protein
MTGEELQEKIKALEIAVAEMETRIESMGDYVDRLAERHGDAIDRLERLLSEETRNREYELSTLEREVHNVQRSSRGY